MNEERWTNFCVVGLGAHAQTKLIPAIMANGQNLAGVVSRRADALAAAGIEAPRFENVAEAVSTLPNDTAFIIASPPGAHFIQAVAALEAGHDVIVEKPAFVTTAEATAAHKAAEASGALLVEGFMNRHTRTHQMFLDEWETRRPLAVESVFTIPAAPQGTFRSDPAPGASNLYDIASYVLAALIDAGVSTDDVHLDKVDNAGEPDRERLHLSGLVDGIRFSATTGVAGSYANSMRLIHTDGEEISFSPFVYGRPGPRCVTRLRNKEQAESVIDDVNAFEAMLATPLACWRTTSDARALRMIELTRQLERLSRQLVAARSAAT